MVNRDASDHPQARAVIVGPGSKEVRDLQFIENINYHQVITRSEVDGGRVVIFVGSRENGAHVTNCCRSPMMEMIFTLALLGYDQITVFLGGTG
jgi:hypothetical protein